MALIGQIRKNMWFVFILLGLALAAFIMMDSSMGGRGGATGTTALEVNGEKIDIQEFNRIESVESSTSGLSGNVLRSKVYDDLITRTIVKEEAEELGLGVPEEEMDGLLFGFNPSPIIQRWFKNPQTGQLDYQQLQQVKAGIEADNLNPGFMPIWETKKEQVVQQRLQDKISTMIAKGIYTPEWMASELSKTNGMTVALDYVKVSPSTIDASSVALTDSDYKDYMAANPAKFNSNEEGRIVEYVVFDIEPSQKDSINIKNKLAEKIPAFMSSQNDSLYAITNGGNYQNYYFKDDELPEAFRGQLSELAIGSTAGPFLNNRFYTVLKVLDRKIVPDSIEASHILISTNDEDPASLTRAKNKIDSLYGLAVSGAADFDSLAINNSEDPGSAPKGGELGYFTQGSMVPPFNDAVFITGQQEGYYTVKTRFGYHLIKVTDVIFSDQTPKHKVAFINSKIIPSSETINLVTNKASEFITNNRSLESMRSTVAADPNLSIKTAGRITKKDYAFEDFGYDDDSRDIIIWAFDDNTSAGDVSANMFSFRDKQFNYESKLVIPALQAEIPKGNARLADVKNSITNEVTEYKKAMILKEEMKGKSLQEIATAYNTQVETINDAILNGSAVPGLGYEPSVVAAIINNNTGLIAEPVIGNNGVYKLNVRSKSPSNSANSFLVKTSNTNNFRRQVASQYFNALKKDVEVEDNRMEFKM